MPPSCKESRRSVVVNSTTHTNFLGGLAPTNLVHIQVPRIVFFFLLCRWLSYFKQRSLQLGRNSRGVWFVYEECLPSSPSPHLRVDLVFWIFSIIEFSCFDHDKLCSCCLLDPIRELCNIDSLWPSGSEVISMSTKSATSGIMART